ncbi:uncharacterized protein LOC108095525 [Drosophila ficusphila]|uniref:uncharacterized protein LOC108095525 n=1 Tax=Drosophila ficusphila TaxID=30025 RepID=UPI0007E6BF3A|nr:uncharacterized protein LOC108095525 [Drosophila ficusphila]
MSEESSQSESGSGSGSGSESEDWPEEDVERARMRGSSEDLVGNVWLSVHGYPPGDDKAIISIFSRFCSVYSYRQRKRGIEIQFTSEEHLQRGVLMAKRLVAGRMPIRWHVGRLNEDPAGATPPPPQGGRNLSVFGKLRKAFANYFHQ